VFVLKESAGDDVNIYSLNRSSIPFPLLEPNQILHRKKGIYLERTKTTRVT
jgi:hypothetical protein